MSADISFDVLYGLLGGVKRRGGFPSNEIQNQSHEKISDHVGISHLLFLELLQNIFYDLSHKSALVMEDPSGGGFLEATDPVLRQIPVENVLKASGILEGFVDQTWEKETVDHGKGVVGSDGAVLVRAVEIDQEEISLLNDRGLIFKNMLRLTLADVYQLEKIVLMLSCSGRVTVGDLDGNILV